MTVIACLSAFPLAAFGQAASPAADAVSFNRDIRPILSDNCFYCHGPDSSHRKAGLRLDTEAGLFGKGDNGPPVVRNKPDESEVWRRIITADEDDLMPPADSHKKLSAEQKALVKRWIEQGAAWQPHWAFVVPARPAGPVVQDKRWARNPVDAFVKDQSANAYETYVDKLMAKPQWGEHRGRYWLDAARYADTHGIHNDNYREMWPYRDWVINAFNRNVPFDRFVVEQIAGDLIADRTLDTQIASGFHRNNITTSEGGSINEEVLAMYDKDRVETTGAVFLGLTTGCAACHDHKFDPITAKDFYSMAAFFRNTTQPAMDGNKPDTPPIVVVPDEKDRVEWEKLAKLEAELNETRKQRRAAAAEGFALWLENGQHKEVFSPVPLKIETFGLASYGVANGTSADVVFTSAEGTRVTQTVTLPAGVTWGDGQDKTNRGLRFADKAVLEHTGFGDFDLDQPFSVAGWFQVPPEEGGFLVASRLDPRAKGQSPGWTLSFETRVPTFRIFGADPKQKIEVRGNSSGRPASGKWVHVAITYDGGRHPAGVEMYLNGKRENTDFTPASVALPAGTFPADTLRLGFDGKRGFKNGAVNEFRLYRRALLPDEVTLLQKWSALSRVTFAKPTRSLKPAEKADLELLNLVLRDGPYQTASAKLAEVERRQREIRKRSSVTHVMAEKPNTPAKTRILFRGAYDQRREEVFAATPEALHPFKETYPKSRLGLAWWVMDERNALTARVTVNRFWQELFGTGLVRTSEDFGIMGENPSHPELLDWLAVEFRENGWDIKKLYKLMVMSATYRQAAVATPEKLAADPQNRLLSRGPRFRMDAEVLRDMALATSGLLTPKIGGPSVKPYQPPGVWEAVAMTSSNTRNYKQDSGESLYRRSMYWFWKRSAPPAPMDVMNAPTREVCTVRRERTNTPLQALVTMNDPQWVEASRRLAERAMTEVRSVETKSGANDVGTFNLRLDFIAQRVLSRPFTDREREICRSAFNDFLATYTNDAEAAKKLIATGESKPDANLPPAELAAWTMLASQVLNLDEALNK